VSSETEFVLIRHAESTWNAAGRWQGHADPPLSEQGRRQASELGDALTSQGIERLIASDLARAAETAAIVGETLGLAPRPDPRLRELNVGAWTGLTREEIERLAPDQLARFERGDLDLRPGGGETRREIRLRVRRAAASIAASHPGQRVALVTHLGAVRALLPGTELPNAGWCRARASQLRAP
jgi:broad specificity phosphatase PhoE